MGPQGPGLTGRTRLILAALGLVMISAATVWVLYGSSWLRLERVTTTGTDVLTRSEVEAAAAAPVGSPLISVDTGAIADRLRQKLPRIDSVDVVRSWPHGVSLKVTERKPVLLVEKGEKFIEVDAQGVRFATVDKAPAHVPLLELKPDRSASLRRFGGDRLLREAVRVAGDLPGKVAGETEVVRVTSYDSAVLELTGGRTVMWGSSEQGPVKARVLAALMKASPKAGHFDVSAPTAPAVSKS
ncbi:FtsQ-type POTRA domain-containing protein [Streptomyces sp. NBC_01693]|uniref:Cell division protein FtsQ n=1 Tax=Streptomyces sp. NBC_00148 TaxID=2903626 RepID=A0AAU1M4N1_9ACTN|nr:FtsQ-type POTRA domain-containing protein [Streptomyces sp. NBC_01174]